MENTKQESDIQAGWLLIFYWMAIIMAGFALQLLDKTIGWLSPLVAILSATIFVMGLALVHRAYQR